MPWSAAQQSLGAAALILLLAWAAAAALLHVSRKRPRENWFPPDTSVLLLVAHPDDECMFFGPTLYGLTRRAARLRVHCLSLTIGNSAGLGAIRRREFAASCAQMGIPKGRVHLVDHPALPDSMGCGPWPLEPACDAIQRLVRRHGISAIVTFDEHGVSGHANHSSCHAAAVAVSRGLDVYALRSQPLWVKYSGALGAAYTLASSAHLVLAGPPSYARLAMQRHASQLVWFRRLFVRFSSYMHVNELVPA